MMCMQGVGGLPIVAGASFRRRLLINRDVSSEARDESDLQGYLTAPAGAKPEKEQQCAV
jgi:hypothetical protein